MQITFYEAPFSSASPITSALLELGVPHERVRIDLESKAQKKPEFLALNPNGKVPTLVVDGTPMFEALAIFHWLGDRFGIARGLWPAADSPARLEALSWTSWTYVSLGAVLQHRMAVSSPRLPAELHSPTHQALAEQEIARLLQIADRRLSGRAYLLGQDYTLVDTALASALTWAAFTGVSLGDNGALKAWLARCQERPAHRAAFSP
jgi:glutathione S-transferase